MHEPNRTVPAHSSSTRLARILVTVVFLTAVTVFESIGFALSYHSLHSVALTNGVPLTDAWMFPVLVDGGIVLGSIGVVRAIAAGRPTRPYWAVVVGFTLVSWAFNVSHAHQSISGWAVATVAPMAQMVALELGMQELRALLVPQHRAAAVPEGESSGAGGVSNVPADSSSGAAESGDGGGVSNARLRAAAAASERGSSSSGGVSNVPAGGSSSTEAGAAAPSSSKARDAADGGAAEQPGEAERPLGVDEGHLQPAHGWAEEAPSSSTSSSDPGATAGDSTEEQEPEPGSGGRKPTWAEAYEKCANEKQRVELTRRGLVGRPALTAAVWGMEIGRSETRGRDLLRAARKPERVEAAAMPEQPELSIDI